MCCCNVERCCCGCTTLQNGIFIWAIVDASYLGTTFLLGINFVLFFVTVIPLLGLSPGYLILIIVFWDILLAVGSFKRIIVLVIVWQIYMMIYIVILFSAWIVGPVMIGYFSVLVDQARSKFSASLDTRFGSVNLQTSNIYTDRNLRFYEAGLGVSAFLTVFTLALPAVYIYFWILVNNFRKDIVKMSLQDQTRLVQTQDVQQYQSYPMTPTKMIYQPLQPPPPQPQPERLSLPQQAVHEDKPPDVLLEESETF